MDHIWDVFIFCLYMDTVFNILPNMYSQLFLFKNVIMDGVWTCFDRDLIGVQVIILILL